MRFVPSGDPARRPGLRVPGPAGRRVRSRERTRRILNVMAAAVGIVLTLPLMILIALLVKLTSRGPVLFVQDRVDFDRRDLDRRDRRCREDPELPRGGSRRLRADRRGRDRGGRIFRIYKFRTMTWDPSPPEVWAAPRDPRVTPLGRVLRTFRMDELPQLFNVLKGDMNLVGPRPEQPTIFERLRDEVEGYAGRQQVLPGITGWAQIQNGYDQNLEGVRRKVGLDLEYVRERSTFRDLWIMVRTLPVIIFRRGAH